MCYSGGEQVGRWRDGVRARAAAGVAGAGLARRADHAASRVLRARQEV